MIFFFFGFLGLSLRHMEVPRLGVESGRAMWGSEPHLRPTPQFTATHNQSWVPDPLSKARDWTCIIVDTSRIPFHYAKAGTPSTLMSWWSFRNSTCKRITILCRVLLFPSFLFPTYPKDFLRDLPQTGVNPPEMVLPSCHVLSPWNLTSGFFKMLQRNTTHP